MPVLLGYVLVTSAAFTLVQIPTGYFNACGFIKVLADWGAGVLVGSWSSNWLLIKGLCI